jgi:hypothetical protein
MGALMGLATGTFEQAFPRSAAALKKHDVLVDNMAGLSHADRMKLKSSAKFLAVVVGEEASDFTKRAEKFGRGALTTISVIRGLFGKK